jgi:hypothetical protein
VDVENFENFKVFAILKSSMFFISVGAINGFAERFFI